MSDAVVESFIDAAELEKNMYLPVLAPREDLKEGSDEPDKYISAYLPVRMNRISISQHTYPGNMIQS